MGRIWKKVSGEEPKEPADRVLENCGVGPGIRCWSSWAGALELAIYLQRHAEDDTEDGRPTKDENAKIRIAYRSFHPEPVRFTRKYEINGGSLASHDALKLFNAAPGRTIGQRSMTARIPDAVSVRRGPNGSQIEAEIVFVDGGLQPSGETHAQLSLLFPDGELKCFCC